MSGFKRISQNITIFVFVVFIITKMTGSLLPINLDAISGAALTVSIIYFLSAVQKGKKMFGKELIPFWLFFIYAFISLVWTRAPEYGLQKMFILSSIVVISFLIRPLIIRRTDLFIKITAISTIAVLLFYFYTSDFSMAKLVIRHSRFTMEEGLNSIVIARYFCFSILVLIFYLRFYKLKKLYKYAVFGLIGMLLVFAIYTGSKGPILAFILALILPYGIGKRLRFKINMKSLALMIAIGVALVYFLIPLIASSDYIASRFVGDAAEGSVTARLALYGTALKNIPNHIIFGHGIGDFGYLFTGRDEPMYPHNMLLEIVYETGLIGFVLFLLLVYKVVKFNSQIGKNLIKNTIYHKLVYFYLSLFYFFFIGAMTTGDIAGNFFVFVSIMFVLHLKKYSFKLWLQSTVQV